jgi:hypothetical protein
LPGATHWLQPLEALFVQPAQLVERLLVVVDAEVEARVVLVAVDAQRRRLLAALVAAGALAGLHGCDQSLGERQAGAGGVSSHGRVEHVGADEHVAGDAEVVVGAMTAPIDATLAGVGGGASAYADRVQLALRAARVGVGQAGDDLVRRNAVGEQVDACGTVERIHQRLRRQRADRAPRVDAERADGEEAAGDGDAEAAVGGAGDDRPGHGVSGAGRKRSRTRATCSASRFAPWAICWRQLVPSATTIASGALRIAGSRLASAIAIETAWWLAS